jgi:hypothetical protein
MSSHHHGPVEFKLYILFMLQIQHGARGKSLSYTTQTRRVVGTKLSRPLVGGCTQRSIMLVLLATGFSVHLSPVVVHFAN